MSRATVVQVNYQNPDASAPLLVPVLVMPNTPEDIANNNIRSNSARDLRWLMAAPEHDGVAVICGGGPSIEKETAAIRRLREDGGTLFGLNGAATWLIDRGMDVDIQVILDAKLETSWLVEKLARTHYFSSQCHPETVSRVDNPILFHLNNTGIEDLLPEDRKARGGYALIGGGVSVGITSLVLAYALGYRKLHLFGFDSCNRDGKTHAYRQDMNLFIPNIDVEWGSKTYNASMPMKQQAEAFPKFAYELQQAGCEISVYGEGLLQAMFTEPPATERQKYQWLWNGEAYRQTAPGESVVDLFLSVAQPAGTVVDFGCGTGRAAVRIDNDTDCKVLLVDFTDNCRDNEALYLPFVQWDLTQEIPVMGDVGFCTDVMEHIPPDDVETVLRNIMASTPRAFFQISTVEDVFGKTIGQPLHLSVHPHAWWMDTFRGLGLRVPFDQEGPISSCFMVVR